MRDDLAVDEAWAAELAERVVAIAPPVPVDVAGAVHRGRRRRAARMVAGSMSALGVAVLGGLAAQWLLAPPESSTPPALGVPTLIRSTEDVDGREQVVVELDGTADAQEAAMARADALIAAQRALLADIDAQIADLPSSGDEADARRVELTGQRAGIELRLDELEAERDDFLNAEYSAWIAEQYALTDLPDVAVVERVPAQDWGRRVADCLRDRGDWDARADVQGGWQVQYNSADEHSFGADLYACAVMYPADLGTPAAG